MQVLHVGSFIGNIGDNANHQGLRRVIERTLGSGVNYHNWEIRRCYQNYNAPDQWRFDDEFVRCANEADLVVIGGGNFFEPWIEASATGTTIDLPLEQLTKITVPVAFYGVGFDTHKGFSDNTLGRFDRFVHACGGMPNVFLSFRNDGSKDNYHAAFPNHSVQPHIVPDGAFFFQCEASTWLPDGSIYWAVNIAGDMKPLRFSGDSNGEWLRFLQNLACVLESNLGANPQVKIVLIPHIPSDLEAINSLLQVMDDFLVRSRVIVAPMWQGWDGCKVTFGLYKQCQLSISMRFHANITPMVMGVPTIGLASYPKIAALYREMGLKRQPVSAQASDFMTKLQCEIDLIKHSPEQVLTDYTQVLKAARSMVEPFERFLRQQFSLPQ